MAYQNVDEKKAPEPPKPPKKKWWQKLGDAVNGAAGDAFGKRS